MNFDDSCPNCERIAKAVEEAMYILKSHGFESKNIFILLQHKGCFLGETPVDNPDLLLAVQMEVLQGVFKGIEEDVKKQRYQEPPEEIKKLMIKVGVSDYLERVKREAKK